MIWKPRSLDKSKQGQRHQQSDFEHLGDCWSEMIFSEYSEPKDMTLMNLCGLNRIPRFNPSLSKPRERSKIGASYTFK